jgi:hypothetical protein
MASGGGCKRGSPPAPAGSNAAPPVAASIDAGAASPEPEAIFSAPIGAARVAGGGAIAVGLVVSSRSIDARRLDAAGKTVWTHPVFPDVHWSADAELHAWPVAAGVAIVWRGPSGKKSGHVAAVVAPDGRILDGPMDVGSLVCGTSDGLAWSEGGSGATTRVRLRAYAAGVSGGAAPAHSDETGPALADDFSLACGDHVAYALVEGDEGSPTRVVEIGGGRGPAAFATLASSALGSDEERDLFSWVDGDALGVVRIASSGEVRAADVHAGGVSLIAGDGARIAPEDDVVAVDADAQQVVLMTTHDATDHCPDGRGGASVHALRIGRTTPSVTSSELAPASCDRDVGPFWTNTLGRSLVAAWPERAARADKSSPAITGLAYRVFTDGATTARLPQPADAIADAGCDGAHCYAVALVRGPGGDAMQPGAFKLLTYP